MDREPASPTIPSFDPKLVAFLERCARVFEKWPKLADSSRRLRELAGAAPEPFRVAIVGRMKAGKSTLINSLIGRPLAIVDAEEATATVNEIHYGTPEQSRQFTAVWKDGRPDSVFPVEKLAEEWTGKTDEVKARVKSAHHLRLFACSEKLRSFVIVDTPGTGSVVQEHETAAREYLRPEAIEDSLAEGRKADAILYVIASAGHDSDKESLSLFGEGRLTAADPYNSLCALHKWDAPKEETPILNASVRANDLQEQLKNHVLKVLPVSAPLGLAAQYAPDDFFSQLLEVLQTEDGSVLEEKLSTSNRWDKDVKRRSARAAYPLLPWTCFQFLMDGFLEECPKSVRQAREACMVRSRLPDLEELLQKHFFANALIIKQCQVLRKAAEWVESGFRSLRQFAEEELADGERARRAAHILENPDLSAWARRKEEDAKNEAARIQALALSISEEWGKYGDHLKGLQRDLGVFRALLVEDSVFPEDYHASIRKVCERTLDQLPPVEELRNLHAYCRRAAHLSFDAEQEDMFRHIERRVEQAHHALKAHSRPPSST